MAKTRFTRILVLGTSADDTLTSSAAGSAIEEFYQGGAGNDTITSGRGKDTFIFESNYAGNGTDTITDFQVRQVDPNGEYDILDLSKAIGKRIYISSDNIGNYVWVEDGKLYVDPQGQKTASTPWAILNGVEAGDQLRVRTGSYDSWITATAKAGPPDYDTIVVGQDANGDPLYWGDVDKDGAYDQGSDVDLAIDGATGKLSDAAGEIDYTTKAWKVVFQAINIGEPVLDLAGFGADEKIVIDFAVNNYMGMQTAATDNGNPLDARQYVPTVTRQYTPVSKSAATRWYLNKTKAKTTVGYNQYISYLGYSIKKYRTDSPYATLTVKLPGTKLQYQGYFYRKEGVATQGLPYLAPIDWQPTGTMAKGLAGVSIAQQVEVIFPAV